MENKILLFGIVMLFAIGTAMAEVTMTDHSITQTDNYVALNITCNDTSDWGSSRLGYVIDYYLNGIEQQRPAEINFTGSQTKYFWWAFDSDLIFADGGTGEDLYFGNNNVSFNVSQVYRGKSNGAYLITEWYDDIFMWYGDFYVFDHTVPIYGLKSHQTFIWTYNNTSYFWQNKMGVVTKNNNTQIANVSVTSLGAIEGDNLSFKFYCRDNDSNSDAIWENITAGNTPPVLTAYNTNPDFPVVTDFLWENITCTDIDIGDTITGYADIYKDNVYVDTSSDVVTNNINTAIDGGLVGDVSGYNASVGDNLSFLYYCSDGTNNSLSEWDNVTVQDSPTDITVNYPLNNTANVPASVSNNPVTFLFNITFSDSDSPSLDYTIYGNDGGGFMWQCSAIANSTVPDTQCTWHYGLSSGQNCSWYVNVTDGTNTIQSPVYTFTINNEPITTLNSPIGSTVIHINSMLLNATVTDNDNTTISNVTFYDDDNGSPIPNCSFGNVTNNSFVICNWTNLLQGTHYWGVKADDGITWSTTYLGDFVYNIVPPPITGQMIVADDISSTYSNMSMMMGVLGLVFACMWIIGALKMELDSTTIITVAVAIVVLSIVIGIGAIIMASLRGV